VFATYEVVAIAFEVGIIDTWTL